MPRWSEDPINPLILMLSLLKLGPNSRLTLGQKK
uniref:Uncharacterized protein n=1 Tax=Arundo donax TaxID=35708 RepID=A0A0A8XYQ6_ARUDO